MAANGSRFIIDDGIIGWFNEVDLVGDAEDEFQDAAEEILAYAQANAPWTDRTGDARSGLGVEVYTDGASVILELFHTVDYGLFLEVIQSGRFATIMPTLEHFAPEVFARMGAGELQITEGEVE